MARVGVFVCHCGINIAKTVDVELVAAQIAEGDARIIGAMIESHLIGGRQDRNAGQELTYGQSITDACISWEDSEPLLQELAEAVRKRRSTPVERN